MVKQCIHWKGQGFDKIRCTNQTEGRYNYCESCKKDFENARKENEKKKHTSFWSWFGF